MREIDNRKIGQTPIADLKSGKVEKEEPQFCAELEESCVKDFSNPKAEALGRSQVSGTDNLKEDVSFGMARPGAVLNSDKLFEMAFKSLSEAGDAEAYEKACTMATSSDARDLLSR